MWEILYALTLLKARRKQFFCLEVASYSVLATGGKTMGVISARVGDLCKRTFYWNLSKLWPDVFEPSGEPRCSK